MSITATSLTNYWALVQHGSIITQRYADHTLAGPMSWWSEYEHQPCLQQYTDVYLIDFTGVMEFIFMQIERGDRWWIVWVDVKTKQILGYVRKVHEKYQYLSMPANTLIIPLTILGFLWLFYQPIILISPQSTLDVYSFSAPFIFLSWHINMCMITHSLSHLL